MRAWFLVVVVAACGGGGKTAKEPVGARDPIDAYNALAVAACTCQDEACVKPIVAEAAELESQPTKAGEDAPKIAAAKRLLDKCAAELVVPDVVQELSKFADDICACGNMSCIERVEKAFPEEFGDSKVSDLSKQETDAIEKLSEKMVKCIERAVGATPP